MREIDRHGWRGRDCGGFIATGALLVAAASTLVLMSVCHAVPVAAAAAACAGTAESAGADAGSLDAMAALTPFDEHFYTPTP